MSLDPDDIEATRWQPIAERTRLVSEQWKALHLAEEAGAKKAAKALEQALAERDALRVSKTAAQQQAGAWRARSAMQTASKVFVSLEETKSVLVGRERQLAQTQRGMLSLQEQHASKEQSRRLTEAAQTAAARERLERLMRGREEVVAELEQLRVETDAVRSELHAQLAANPPGALDEARARGDRLATLVAQLERRCDDLRSETVRWRGRANTAIAGERLVQLHAGPAAMVRPGGAGASAATGAADTAAELQKLRTDVAFWRDEATQEREWQSGFQQALWASSAFSEQQKSRLMQMLRQASGPTADPYCES